MMYAETPPAPPAEIRVIKPQPGPQTQFLSSSADIAIYGGAAGGGKTYALLLEPLRHISSPEFGAVFFRRTYVQITNEGAMWDESETIYPLVGAKPKRSALEWHWSSGSVFSFAHMQHESDKLQWQGSQIPYIGFDELTHFSETQFFYMLSRNRSGTWGGRPYIRATCNPDANSWVRKLLVPWLGDPEGTEDGEFSDPAKLAKSGELRYFVRVNGDIKWVSKDYVTVVKGRAVRAKSITFVAASVFDNQILLEKDPEYLANLLSLPHVEQQRLLYGNWDIVESGNMFRKEWFMELNPFEVPMRFKRIVRDWDLASSKPSLVEKQKADPDYTASILYGLDYDKRYIILDMTMMRDTPSKVEAEMKRVALADFMKYGGGVEIVFEEEPGSNSTFLAEHFKNDVFKGYNFNSFKSTGSKIARAKTVSAEAQNGNVYVVKAAWNGQFYALATAFPSVGTHDDPVDALSSAHTWMNMPPDKVFYSPRMIGVQAAWSAGTMGTGNSYPNSAAPSGLPTRNGGRGGFSRLMNQ